MLHSYGIAIGKHMAHGSRLKVRSMPVGRPLSLGRYLCNYPARWAGLVYFGPLAPERMLEVDAAAPGYLCPCCGKAMRMTMRIPRPSRGIAIQPRGPPKQRLA